MTQAEHQLLAATLQQEQHNLHDKINEWREWWNELSELGQPRFGEMNDRVTLIRNRLKSHFEHEETSGFFQDMAQLHPKHAQTSARLLSDHQKFLDDLLRLCEKLGAAEPEFESWGEAKQMFEDLLDELETHEREESNLMKLWAKPDESAN